MKRGFTLVELLAVITLLGMLLAFTYPKIADIKEKKEKELDSAKVTLIENAAKSYMDTNLNEYSQNIGDTHCIELDTLVNENLVPVDIKEIQEKYNYVKVKIGLNGNNSYTLVKTDSLKACDGKDHEEYPEYVYLRDSLPSFATHIGYPIKANVDMGDKYVYPTITYVCESDDDENEENDPCHLVIPYESKSECVENHRESECVLQKFKTYNMFADFEMKYFDEYDNDSYYNIRFKLDKKGIIQDAAVCGNENGKQICISRIKNKSDFNEKKQLILNTFNEDDCRTNADGFRCYGTDFGIGIDNEKDIYFQATPYESYGFIYGNGAVDKE